MLHGRPLRCTWWQRAHRPIPSPYPPAHCIARPNPRCFVWERDVLGRRGYVGPAPPRAHGPHRYVFQIFALDRILRTDIAFDRKTLLREIEGRVLARGRLIGIFERN
jgi:phosphatidylethanolamine-binding protein (PEBP) family uncharacterized protein